MTDLGDAIAVWDPHLKRTCYELIRYNEEQQHLSKMTTGSTSTKSNSIIISQK